MAGRLPRPRRTLRTDFVRVVCPGLSLDGERAQEQAPACRPMPLFVAQHQHPPETCPASTGSQLLSQISAAAAARHGVTIEAEAPIDGEHRLLLVVDAADQQEVEVFLAPLRESGELSAVILLVVSLAGIFAYSLSTLGVIDPLTRGIVNSGLGEYGVMALLILLLVTVGMFLDGVSIFLIFVPLLLPIVLHYHWNQVWFGVILTLMVAVGQFTPPMAVNLMVSCRIAKIPMEDTVPWVMWLLGSMLVATLLVVAVPELALWLPRRLGY